MGILSGLLISAAGLLVENYDIHYSKHEGCCNNGRGRMDYSDFKSLQELEERKRYWENKIEEHKKFTEELNKSRQEGRIFIPPPLK